MPLTKKKKKTPTTKKSELACSDCWRTDVIRAGKVTGHGIVGPRGQQFCRGVGKAPMVLKVISFKR